MAENLALGPRGGFLLIRRRLLTTLRERLTGKVLTEQDLNQLQ